MKTIQRLLTLKQAAAIATATAFLALLPGLAEASPPAPPLPPPPLTFTNLHSFSVFPGGAVPAAALAQGSDGNFYGTTTGGGTNGGYGTVFKVTPGGAATVLYEFTGAADGASPNGLVPGSDGAFYGTTSQGGAYGAGSIFKIATDGTLTSLYSFTGGANGANPQAALVQGSDGYFYGTTAQGGAGAGYGTVFKITTNGALTRLYAFTNGTDGARPQAALLEGSDGYFGGTTAGTTVGGKGTNGSYGSVFKISTNGALQSLRFTGGIDGARPLAALVRGMNGDFYAYGTTSRGGANGAGNVFKVTTNGVLTVLYSFTGGADGANPQAALVLNTNDGSFYGTASSGGMVVDYSNGNEYPGNGTVFKITTNGVLTSLYTFTGGSDGANPSAALAQGSDGSFYGTAQYGGVGYSRGGNGTVFKIAGNGTFAALYAFPGVNDGQSAAALVHGSDGNFYGTTQYGGTNGGNGTVFKVAASGAFASLYSFAGSYDGANPATALVQGSDGDFYGTTQGDGSNYSGTVFEISPGGTLDTLYAFTGGYDGNTPNSALVQGSDGNFYGTTSDGGFYGNGNVFKITADGLLTSLYSFTGYNDGAYPNGLVLGSDGAFYGTASSGGFFNNGSVFQVTTDGNLNPLYFFTGTNDGGSPMSPLVQGGDGNFYGTTQYGGTGGGNGTVFKITPNGSLTTLYSFSNDTNGGSPSGLLAGTDGNFYGTTAGGGYNYSGSVFEITSGGVLRTLYSFSGGTADGGAPYTSLAQGGDGSLYGTTSSGAVGGYGGVFRLSGATLPSPLPMITGQPASVSNVLAGLSASFTVTAVGGQPLHFQWQHNGVDLSTGGEFFGTTLPSLTVDPAFAGDAGTYSVTVFNSYGSVASSNAVLSLYSATNSGEAYTDGTNYLAEADLAAANLSFANAISLSANPSAGANSSNYFFLAATELLSLPEEPAGSNFLNRLGVSTTGRDVFKWKAKLAYKIPIGVNADEFTAQLRTNVLAAIIAAEADLAAITNTDFTLPLTASETHAGAVTVDWGDVQLLRALCDAAEVFIYTTYSWNLNAQLTDVSNILATDKSIGTLLADYPNLLTTTSTSDLPLAKGAFTNGINEYFAASQFIRGRTNLTRLFNLTSTNEMAKELKFRQTLTNLLASLSSGSPVTLTDSTNIAVSAAAFFGGHFDPRAYFPQFQGSEFVWNTIPDPTFGGVIKGLTETEAASGLLKHFKIKSVLAVPGVSVDVLCNFPNFLEQNGVVQGLDGNLYGTTQFGPIAYTTNYSYSTNTFPGTNGYVITNITTYTNVQQNQGYGTVFKITPSGQYSTLYTFGSVQLTNISGPYTNVYYKGTNVFYFTYYNTNIYQLDGTYPGALVLGADGDFYGATQSGGLSYQTNYNGTNLPSITTNSYNGTLFKITPSGHLTTLYNFGTAADQYANTPAAALAQGSDGRFYGTTEFGGTNNGAGTVFAVTTNGAITLLYVFTNHYDGGYPSAPLAQGVDGNFYGTTSGGGTNYEGNIFKITPSGHFSTLYSFGAVQLTNISGPYTNVYYNYNGSGYVLVTNVYYKTNTFPLDGAYPNALVQGADGNFYGTTQSGGTNDVWYEGDGTAFRISPAGAFSNLLSFDREFLDGYSPLGSLVAGANGVFYGTASAGGANNVGALFALNSSRAQTNIFWFGKSFGGYGNNLHSYFNFSYAYNPIPSPLVLGADGNYYGTTTDDGSNGSGTVFRLSISSPPGIVTQPVSQTNLAGSTVSFEVSAIGSAPLIYRWFLDGKPLFNAGDVSGAQSNVLTLTRISSGDIGVYSVVVSNSLGSATSSAASLVVLLPPSITAEPLDQLIAAGESATFTVTAGGTQPLSYQWQFDGTNISGATNASVSAANAGSYAVVVTNAYGSVTSSVAGLDVETASTGHPSLTISITSPAAGGRTASGVEGKASGKLPVWNVFYRVTNYNKGTNITSGQAVLASGAAATNWFVTNNLLPGTNIIAVQAIDLASNHSPVVTRKFFYEVTAPLNLLAQGTGSGSFALKSFVSGEKNLATNTPLNIGEPYQITAKPDGHSLFGGWTVTTTNSSLSTNRAAIRFIMESSLRISADFETNIYFGAFGTYNGLFVVSNNLNDVTEATAGLLGGLLIHTNGNFSGKLWIDGGSHPIGGVFDAYGDATNKVTIPGGHVLLQMTLDTSTNPPQVFGTVSGSNNGAAWTADLVADRAANNLPAAEYTMLIPPGTNAPPTSSPGGFGYALITNSAGGAKTVNTARITGALADGTTFSQSVPVSEDGYVPFYDSLYGNKGLLLGWINLEVPNTNTTGLIWIHPKTTGGRYKTGFTNIVPGVELGGQVPLPLLLSPWTNPPTDLGTLTNLVISVTNSAPADLFDFGVSFSGKNLTLSKVSGTGVVTGSINPKTGLLKVTFGSKPAKTTNGFGAILQNAAFGGGYFLTLTNGEAVELGP